MNSSLCINLQMTEQRKHKQRIGLLGNPAHLNINPQQPAWKAGPEVWLTSWEHQSSMYVLIKACYIVLVWTLTWSCLATWICTLTRKALNHDILNLIAVWGAILIFFKHWHDHKNLCTVYEYSIIGYFHGVVLRIMSLWFSLHLFIKMDPVWD